MAATRVVAAWICLLISLTAEFVSDTMLPRQAKLSTVFMCSHLEGQMVAHPCVSYLCVSVQPFLCLCEKHNYHVGGKWAICPIYFHWL